MGPSPPMSSVGEELGGVARNTKRMRTSSISSDQEGRFGEEGGGFWVSVCMGGACGGGMWVVRPSGRGVIFELGIIRVGHCMFMHDTPGLRELI